MRAMRADGMTYQKIADAVGVSRGTAHSETKDVELSKNGKLPGADGKSRPATYAKRVAVEDVELSDFGKLPGADGKMYPSTYAKRDSDDGPGLSSH